MTDEFRVGERIAAAPEPSQFDPKPMKKGKPPEPLSFEVVMTAEATEKQRKTGAVQVNIPGFSPVRFYCDEDVPVGDDTAPPPLAYVCAGIGFCPMTHLTDIYTARKINVTSMRLEQRVGFPANFSNMRQLGHTTYGRTEHIEKHVLIESDEAPETIQALMEEAENACMAHFALRNPIPWRSRLLLNGQELMDHSG